MKLTNKEKRYLINTHSFINYFRPGSIICLTNFSTLPNGKYLVLKQIPISEYTIVKATLWNRFRFYIRKLFKWLMKRNQVNKSYMIV